MKTREEAKDVDLTKEEKVATKDMNNLRVSHEKKGVKTITYQAFCNTDEKIKTPKDQILSKTCQFGIFIRSKNKDGKGKVHYELSVEDEAGSHQLVKNHFLRVK